jgi:hypothetical protein
MHIVYPSNKSFLDNEMRKRRLGDDARNMTLRQFPNSSLYHVAEIRQLPHFVIAIAAGWRRADELLSLDALSCVTHAKKHAA